MLEERTSRPPVPRSTGSESERTSEKSRAAIITRMILTGMILSVAGMGAYALIYVQTGLWQVLADGAGLLLGLACLALAHWSVRRDRLDTAGYWLLLALLITYAATELIWAGETWYNLVGASLLFLLVGNLVLRHKWWAWLGMAGVYAAFVYLVNQFEPIPRYNAIEESGLIFLLDLGLTALLLLLAIWLLYRISRSGTIRTRLLVAFVSLVLLPVIAIVGAIAVTGRISLEERVVDQLETVAESKEAEIETWMQTLQIELAALLNAEDTRVHAPTLLREEDSAPTRRAAYEALREQFQLWAIQNPQFEELFIIDQQGRVVLSTDATHEGQIHSYQTYFWEGLKGRYTTLLYYSRSLGQPAMVTVQPIVNQKGETLGVLAGYADMALLSEIMRAQAWLGETGETYLVKSNYTPMTNLRHSVPGQMSSTDMHTEGIDTVLETHANGSGTYDNYQGEPVIGVYRWLPNLQLALLVEESRAEALSPLVVMLAGAGGIAAVATGLAVIAALLTTRSIAVPLTDMAETATQVAAGDLERTVEVEREDEIGTLAQTFNSMTTQLRELVGSLEQRVAKRTYELEQRSAYMQASAEVGRAASSILDADQLIQQVVELIRERFGLYYVGLFLVDEAGEWAILRAGTGEAGRAMLARGHRLRVSQGMIGWSIAHAQARVALQAEKDAVRKVTAELPDTRSEAALPLRSRGQIIGALTVQSTQFNAFDEDIIAVLQIMADQVAVALDNARLYTESRSSLEATRRAYSELSRKGWIELLRSQPDIGYRSEGGSIAPAGEIQQPEIEQALRRGECVVGNETGGGESPLAVPIKVRDDVIGVLNTHKPAGAGEWTPDEIVLLEALTEQVGLALEGARLYQEAQRSAARERLTREITDKMRRATNVEDVVRTAVDELFGMLGTSRAFVQLGVAQPGQGGDSDKDDGHRQ
jgi:GAF domain-containing protein/HAMP domain-containing protein